MPSGLASNRRLRHWRRIVLSSIFVGSSVILLELEGVVCWVFRRGVDVGVLGCVGSSKLSVLSDVGVLGCVGLSELFMLEWIGLPFGVVSSGVSVIPRLRLGLEGHESVVIQMI